MAVTIGEQVGQQNSYHGPFISSNGDVFTILQESTGANDAEIIAFRATDPTSSFTESDSGNRPQMGSAAGTAILSMNVAQAGDDLHVFTQNEAEDAYYARVDMSAASFVGAWQDVDGSANTEQIANNDTNNADAEACDLVVRAGQSDVLGVWQYLQEADMGTNYERIAFDTKADLTTGAWGGSPAYIGSNGMGVAIHVTGPRCVYEPVSGRTHVVFSEGTYLAHTSIASNDAITDNGDIGETPAVSSDLYPVGHGISFDRGGTKKIRFPYIDADADISIVEFDDAASPGYTFEDGVDGANDVAVDNGSVNACLALDGSTVHLAHVRASDDDLYTANDAGTDTWTTPASSFTGTINHISCNVFGFDNAYYLAQVFDDGGTVKFDWDDITSAFTALSEAEFPQQNTYIGPHEGPTADHKYTPCVSPDGHDLVMMKATAASPTDGQWTQTDGAIKPFLGRGYNAIQDPILSVWSDFGTVGADANSVAVAYQQESGRVGFSAFDTDTDTWDIFDEEVSYVGATTGFDNPPDFPAVCLIVKGTGDEVIVTLAKNDTTPGDLSEAWTRSSGGTWTSRDTAVSNINDNSHMTLAGPNGSGDTAILFHSRDAGTPLMFTSGFQGTDGLNASNQQCGSSSDFDTAYFNFGRGIWDGSNFVIPYLNSDDTVQIVELDSYDDAAETITTGISANTVENNGATSAPFPALCLAYDSGNSETVLAYVRDSDGDIYVATDVTGTPTGDGTALVAATAERISCEYASTATELWIVYDDAGTLKFVIKTLGAAGHTATGALNFGALAVAGTAHMDPTAIGAIAFDELAVAGAGEQPHEAAGAIDFVELAINGVAHMDADGVGAVTLIELAIAGAALQIMTASGAIDFVELAINGDGTSIMLPTGVGAIALVELAVNATGEQPHEGAGAVALIELAINGAGEQPHTASGAVALDELAINGDGLHVQNPDGVGAIALNELEIAGAALQIMIASGAITLNEIEIAGAGDMDYEGAGAIALVELAVSASGVQIFTATAAIDLVELALAGTGHMDPTAVGALEFIELAINGSGLQIFTGAGAIALDEIEISGTGDASEDHTGTGAIALIELAIAASAHMDPSGVGAIELIELAIDGAGVQIITGTGAVALDELAIAGTALQIMLATGAIALNEIEIDGTAVQVLTGTGAITLQEIEIAATAIQAMVASGAIELDEIAIAGIGVGAAILLIFNRIGPGGLVGPGGLITAGGLIA